MKFVVSYIVSFYQRITRKRVSDQLQNNGIYAEAIVLDISFSGKFVKNIQWVSIQVQVQPERGRNFVTEIRESMELLVVKEISVGSRIRVIYNPHNYKEVMLAVAA